MKKVLMVLENEFPPDNRVEKEIKSLTEAGYDVRIAALTFLPERDSREDEDQKVYRKYISHFLYKSSAASLLLPFYFSFWRRFMEKILAGGDFQIVHVHDLPLTRVAYRLCRKYNMKLVADQHEFYSNWIGRTAHMRTLPGRIISFFSRWEKYEKKYLQKADLVITVSESLRGIYKHIHQIDENKIICVPNTPTVAEFTVSADSGKIKEKYKNRFVLFYGGMIDILRGIDLLINALPIVRKEIPNILVILSGRIRKNCDPAGHAKSLGVDDLVEYVGFKNRDELRAYMDASSICFATSPADSVEVNNSIPTKIYDYIAARKPILVGRAALLKDFVEKYNLGFSADEKDPESIAETIIRMKNNMGSFTFDVPGNIMYWEHTTRIMIEKYKDL